ncbi:MULTISPECIES: GNAT family N-acetyltransferase [unclassified Marinovum]
MHVTLWKVDAAHKAQLRDMLRPYLLELGQYGNVDLDYPYLDAYWVAPDRWPYMLDTDDMLDTNDGPAGFALVNTHALSDRPLDFALAEFYVCPAFRGAGVGQRAVRALLATHPGVWELGIMRRNAPARAFWRQTLSKLTLASLERTEVDDAELYHFSTHG